MKVFVVEDSPLVRERLVAMLQDITEVEVAGEADTPVQALAGIRSVQPDVVILDVKLREGSGMQVLQTLRREAPGVATIVLTNYADAEHRQTYLAAGALHFFDKTAEFEKVSDVLEQLITAAKAS